MLAYQMMTCVFAHPMLYRVCGYSSNVKYYLLPISNLKFLLLYNIAYQLLGIEFCYQMLACDLALYI